MSAWTCRSSASVNLPKIFFTRAYWPGWASLASFRPLLDGTTDWPAVLDAFDKIGYKGYLTFEYFHPFQHYPEALIYQTSDALDRMLGRKK